MSKLKTLAFLNFSDKQQQDFLSILILSEQGLDDNWSIVKKKQATIIFVQSDTNLTPVQWKEIEQTYPQAKLVAYSENLINLEIQWTLLTKKSKPPLRSSLIALLNKIGKIKLELKLESDGLIYQDSEESIKIQENKTKINLFFPERYLLGVIQKSLDLKKIYHCKISNKISLFLLPQQNCYFCDVEITDLKPIFLMPPKEINITVLKEKELKKHVKNLKTKALNDLLWHSTIAVSQGRFMKNHNHEDRVRLKYWPDISQISTNKSYLTIANFMSNNTENVIKIAQQTQQQLSDVVDFYNACNILGLIDKTSDLSLVSKPLTNSTLINSFVSKKLYLEVAA